MAIYETKNPTKDGRKYYFRIKYKDIFGKTHDYSSQKFKSPKEAKLEEARYRLKIEDKDVCVSTITLDQIYLEFIEDKKTKIKKQAVGRLENLYRHLEPIHNLKIKDIDLIKYRQLKTYIANKNFSTIHSNKILALFKALIVYSNKYYNTSTNILKYVENFKNANEFKKEMDFFTYDEFLKFESVINEFEYKVFFEVLYFLGLRQGEATGLNWNDIDFNKGLISIKRTLTTKIKGEKWTISVPKTKNSIRTLPLTKKLLESLKKMQDKAKAYKDYSDDWFVFGNSIPFKETTIQKKKNNYCDKAGLRHIRIHDFRHSCASLLINQGASIALVSKYLGHGSITITLNTYTHMYKSELNNITEMLNKL